jgi:TonB family protein
MKKAILTILLLLCAPAIYAQTDDRQALKELNQNLVAAYNLRDYDGALKYGRQALDLSLKVFGGGNPETAVAYSNLGAIYREKRKYGEAIENYEKALDIYWASEPKSGKELAKTYEDLAVSYASAEKKKEAEENFLKALDATERVYGKESRETLGMTLAAARFYAGVNLDKSDELFLRSYELAAKIFGKDSEEVGRITDARMCVNVGSPARQKKFDFSKKTLLETDDGGILNGKALDLPKPDYPPAAKAIRATGTVVVKIWIDEQGNVSKSEAVCGHPLLQSGSRESARKAKFSPPTRNGQPLAIKGYIFYNFLAY